MRGTRPPHRPQAGRRAGHVGAQRVRGGAEAVVGSVHIIVKPPYHLLRAAWRRFFPSSSPPTPAYAEVVAGRTWACTDLGAFARPLPPLDGLEGVVIMEDRDPEFFLGFRGYDPRADTRLNRHGPLHAWSNQEDLRKLVTGLQAQRIKVAIGFWNYGGWAFHRKARWLREHPEVKRLFLSSHLIPFVRLREGMTYAEYIGDQYKRLYRAFGFDGLMLGDGFCGFSSIWDPDRYTHEMHLIPKWTQLYAAIADAVHATRGILLAYDQMGSSYEEARAHGVDYRLLALAGLDILVYQAYPQAWAKHWLDEYASRFDLGANVAHITSVRAALMGPPPQVLYTLEIGDSIERWQAEPAPMRAQMTTLDPLSDGRFLVWANDVFAGGKSPVRGRRPS